MPQKALQHRWIISTSWLGYREDLLRAWQLASTLGCDRSCASLAISHDAKRLRIPLYWIDESVLVKGREWYGKSLSEGNEAALGREKRLNLARY